MTIKKLGIIAGGGNLPANIISKAKGSGLEVFVLAIRNESNLTLSDINHEYVDIGSIGLMLELLKTNNVQDVVFAGKIKRPSFSSLKVDKIGFKLLAQITKAKFLGDDSVLRSIVKFVESYGFNIIGTDNILGDTTTGLGIAGKFSPTQAELNDIEVGKNILKTMGPLDIGQALIIENSLVLGIEAAEGTDALILRCKDLKRESSPCGILVKMKKASQEERIDLPSIGTDTIDNLYNSDFRGIAIEANSCLIIDKEKVINLADQLGLFIIGI